MPGTAPVADGRPDEQGQSTIIRLIYIEIHTHTHTGMLHIYVYMRTKIERYFVVHRKTSYLQWVAFLERHFKWNCFLSLNWYSFKSNIIIGVMCLTRGEMPESLYNWL